MTSTAPTRANITPRLTRRRSGIASYLRRLCAVRRQRLALVELPPWLLKDIGNTRPKAIREARRRWWDIR
ncbi:hypothetical protein [uncultured Roseobacter sp.]|uniref:hypothetical protein n=1 Tax=uncultured Roseobacter sp. TaxID=114847 RepID=UPI002635F437|nr:hypothetical protein [uncultured Roseobacter sp.]